MTLQLSFDFRFAWADAKLSFPFVQRGITPEAVSTFLLPRLIGTAKASSVLLTGDTLSPKSPYVESLYHQILPTREAVVPAALDFAHKLASMTSATSVALTKALLWHGKDTVEEHHLLDSRAIYHQAKGADAAEGVAAFKERRLPKFRSTVTKDLPSWVPWVSSSFTILASKSIIIPRSGTSIASCRADLSFE